MSKKKPKRIWDNCMHIGELMKTHREKFVVELVARNGVRYVNIRGWYLRKKDQVWRPGRDGIVVPIKIPINEELQEPIQELLELIAKALPLAADFPIEDEENAVWYPPKED